MFSQTLSDRFKKGLESIKLKMPTGDPSIGMPVLEPLDISNYNIKIEEKDRINIEGSIKDFHMEGLCKYDVTNASLKMPFNKNNVNLGFTWALIQGKTNYNIDGSLGPDIPIYGAGDIQ